MDNVQNCDSFINILSLQICRSYAVIQLVLSTSNARPYAKHLWKIVEVHKQFCHQRQTTTKNYTMEL
jgi:hypothetical protein